MTIKRLWSQAWFTWLTASVLAGLILFTLHTVAFANQEPSISELIRYIESGNTIEVSSVSQQDYQHVYYFYSGNAFYITEGSNNNSDPHSEGRFITWVKVVNGQGQIMLYDLFTRTLLQVTSSSTNLNPRVDGAGNVVWERWDGSTWQVYYRNYASRAMQQISEESDGALRPDVRDGEVVYSRRLVDGTWEAVKRKVESGTSEVIASGNSTETWPQFTADGSITTKLIEYVD